MAAATPREERLARNEQTFRMINEQASRAASRENVDEPLHSATCECSNDQCDEQLFLSPNEYAAVRQHETRFAVAPGHDAPEIERVVERHSRYWVVEKRQEKFD
jgi:hypothetical protein